MAACTRCLLYVPARFRLGQWRSVRVRREEIYKRPSAGGLIKTPPAIAENRPKTPTDNRRDGRARVERGTVTRITDGTRET